MAEGGSHNGDPSWAWRPSNDEDELQYAPQAEEVGSDASSSVVVVGELLDQDENQPLLHTEELSTSYHTVAMDSTLLSDAPPSHKTQYLTALAATMGALSMGAILGYSSPASIQLAGVNSTVCDYDNFTNFFNVTEEYCEGDCNLIQDKGLTDNELSWFSSSVNLGALVGAPTTGFLLNKIGRRTTMIVSVFPFILGWVLIGAASNFSMLVIGRVVTGFCAGMISLAVPTYLGEIASADVRGLLGTCFQLMVTIGILYVYAIGAGVCWSWLALACLVPSFIFASGMFLSKESPSYLLLKNKNDEAKSVLKFFRGETYPIDQELNTLQQSITESQQNKGSFKDLLLPHNMKPLFIAISLMLFQQFSGINAILFNLTTIFESAGSSLSSDASSIIIAVVQVVATAIASVLMDKAGRKLLLIISSSAMTVALVLMGVFFYLKETKGDEGVESLGWLPLFSLIIFIAFFSIGFGPVPWVFMGELFGPDVRELAGSIATMTNWLSSFIVTLIFAPLQKAINDSGVYWLFAGACVLNLIFCFIFVEETKGKTTQEIAAMFGAPVTSPAEEKHSSRASSVSKHSSRASSVSKHSYTNHINLV